MSREGGMFVEVQGDAVILAFECDDGFDFSLRLNYDAAHELTKTLANALAKIARNPPAAGS